MAPINPLIAMLAARAQQAGSGSMRPTPGQIPAQGNRQFQGNPFTKGRPNSQTASQRKRRRKRKRVA